MQLASALSLLLGFIGIYLLIHSQLALLGKRVNVLTVIVFAIIGSNYKQMQNYFMPICNGWMLAMFFIGLYYFNKQRPPTRMRTLTLCICVLLAPLSIGIGMILPLAELIEFTYRISKKKKAAKKKIENSGILLASFSLASICIYFAYKLQPLKDISTIETQFQLSSVTNILSHPISAVEFVLSLTGSVFVPSSRFEPRLPTVAGLLFVSTVIFLLTKSKKNFRKEDLLLNQNCLVGGILYIMLLLGFRFSGSREDLITAAAPRYVTGSLILILGLVVLVVNQATSKKLINSFIAVLALCILVGGTKTGLEWHSKRYGQSQELSRCTKDEFLVSSSSCYTLALTNSMTPTEEFFRGQLQKFLKESNFAR
jgi:hypothetical protein